jgi:hypothetical protein
MTDTKIIEIAALIKKDDDATPDDLDRLDRELQALTREEQALAVFATKTLRPALPDHER